MLLVMHCLCNALESTTRRHAMLSLYSSKTVSHDFLSLVLARAVTMLLIRAELVGIRAAALGGSRYDC